MNRLLIFFACLTIPTWVDAQGITLLYKNNFGWDNAQSWVQINIPVGQLPIRRVPTPDDDVVFSYAMSGISQASYVTNDTETAFNIGGSNANGPSRCRSLQIRNTDFSVLFPSFNDYAPEVNVYTSNGGFVILDSGTNLTSGHFNLHGGNPAVTDLQLLQSDYGTLFSHASRSSIKWKSGARLRMVSSYMGGYFFEGEQNANIFIDNSTIETNYFKIGANSSATLQNSTITNNSNNNHLEFSIGKNTNFVSSNNTLISHSKLRFTTSGSQFNGNVIGLGHGPGDIDFLQADPANPLPNIINGNFSASELTTGLGISGDLKISGNFSGYPDAMFNTPIPVMVNSQQVFVIGGIKNYRSSPFITNCVQNFCHFKLEFFGNSNSNIWWNGGFPVDTLIINKTNCAKLTCDSSLYVSGATRIVSGQLRLDPDENIPYKFVCAGNVDIAPGAGLFLRRNGAGVTANMAIGGTLTDQNANPDSLCVGLSNPYNGLVTFYRLVALPLTLLDFDGKYENKAVALAWSTEKEINVDHFVIEKSGDQRFFSPIAGVAASAFGPIKKDYRYTDRTLLHPMNYYRLKIVDADGKFTYSNIIAIATAREQSFTVFPNPVTDKLFLKISGIVPATEIRITDGKGACIRRIQVQAGATNLYVNTADLPAGIYSISFVSNQGKYSQQFIKN